MKQDGTPCSGTPPSGACLESWHITTGAEVDQWGGYSQVRLVPTGTLTPGAFEVANSGMLYRERTSQQVYVVVLGSGRAINTSADLDYFGGEALVKTVPLGSLYDAYTGPLCGDIVRERSSSTVYELKYTRTTLIFSKRVTSQPANGVVPDGHLAGIPETTAPLWDCID